MHFSSDQRSTTRFTATPRGVVLLVLLVGFGAFATSQPDLVFGYPTAALFEANFLATERGGGDKIAAADANGDGVDDLFGVPWDGNTLSISLSNSNGTFQEPIDIATGNRPKDLALADLDLDGDIDIAVANYLSNTISVWLGYGNGTFALKSHFQPAGTNPVGVRLGLFDGDQIPDLAVINELNQDVLVSLGLGDGTFASVSTLPIGLVPKGLELADVNDDGQLDVIVMTTNGTQGFRVFLGNGNGSFQSGITSAVSTCNDFTLGDFNGDGRIDIAGAQEPVPTGQVRLYWGNGLGGFSSGPALPAVADAKAICTLDVNRDGILDLAVVANQADVLSLFIGAAGGVFPERRDMVANQALKDVTATDLDDDTWPDIATGGHGFGVYYNNLQGSFLQGYYISVPNLGWAAGADMNNDGQTDIVAISGSSQGVTVYIQGGDGSFLPPIASGVLAGSAAIGDCNSDGIQDVVCIQKSTGTLKCLLGVGDGSLISSGVSQTGALPISVALSDFDRDGDLDALVANKLSNSISVLPGNGLGQFGVRTDFQTGTEPEQAIAADLNGDGLMDLIVACNGSLEVRVHLCIGGANWAPSVGYFSPGANAVSVGDLNEDGKLDLVVADGTALAVFIGNGQGGFGQPAEYQTGFRCESVALADFNGDGYIDAVADGDVGSYVTVLMGDGTGALLDRVNYGAAEGVHYVVSCDIDGNFSPDLLIASQYIGLLTFLTNISGATTTGVPDPVAPSVAWLEPAFPNPSTGGIALYVEIPVAGRARVDVFDLNGRLISPLYNSFGNPRRDRVVWNGRTLQGENAAAGTYVIRLVGPTGHRESRKVIILR